MTRPYLDVAALLGVIAFDLFGVRARCEPPYEGAARTGGFVSAGQGIRNGLRRPSRQASWPVGATRRPSHGRSKSPGPASSFRSPAVGGPLTRRAGGPKGPGQDGARPGAGETSAGHRARMRNTLALLRERNSLPHQRETGPGNMPSHRRSCFMPVERWFAAAPVVLWPPAPPPATLPQR